MKTCDRDNGAQDPYAHDICVLDPQVYSHVPKVVEGMHHSVYHRAFSECIQHERPHPTDPSLTIFNPYQESVLASNHTEGLQYKRRRHPTDPSLTIEPVWNGLQREEDSETDGWYLGDDDPDGEDGEGYGI